MLSGHVVNALSEFKTVIIPMILPREGYSRWCKVSQQSQKAQWPRRSQGRIAQYVLIWIEMPDSDLEAYRSGSDVNDFDASSAYKEELARDLDELVSLLVNGGANLESAIVNIELLARDRYPS